MESENNRSISNNIVGTHLTSETEGKGDKAFENCATRIDPVESDLDKGIYGNCNSASQCEGLQAEGLDKPGCSKDTLRSLPKSSETKDSVEGK